MSKRVAGRESAAEPAAAAELPTRRELDVAMSDRRRDPRDYVCCAMSPNGFICNKEPKHDGDHVAYAGPERYEADQRERAATSPSPDSGNSTVGEV